MEKVFDIYIRTTPEALWEAISDEETRRRYTFQTPPGLEDGDFATGETVEADAPHRFVQTMDPHWSPAVESHPPTRVTGSSARGARAWSGCTSRTATSARMRAWRSTAAGRTSSRA